MDKDMMEQFQMLFSAIEDVRVEVKEVRAEVKEVREEVRESEARTKVFIENEVTKRIDALFDGYKLTHEKQWELERQTQALQQQVDDLQNRLAALESKIA